MSVHFSIITLKESKIEHDLNIGLLRFMKKETDLMK